MTNRQNKRHIRKFVYHYIRNPALHVSFSFSASHQLIKLGDNLDELSMDDKNLIRSVALNDISAFKLLVELHQELVIGLAYKFTRNHQDAEDLAQEVFFTVWKNAGKFRGDASLSTWLYRITVNKALNFRRKHKKEKEDTSPNQLLNQQASPNSQPDRNMEIAENKKLLYKALEALPEKLRIPFMLHKLEGMSHQEIAQVLEISVANVETRIHRAKNNLQKILIELIK